MIGDAPTVTRDRRLPWQTKAASQFEPSELVTLEHALRAAGADFDVETSAVRTRRPDLTIPDFRAIRRADTKAVLGVVGDRYKPLQTAIALAPADGLAALGVPIIAAWSLRGGRTVGVVAQLPDVIELPGDPSPTHVNVILRTSHDGNSSVTAEVMPVRDYCLNALPLDLAAAHRQIEAGLRHKRVFRFRHVGDVETRLTEAARALDQTRAYVQGFQSWAQGLATQRVVEREVKEILERAFPIEEDATDAVQANSIAGSILRQWRSTDTLPEVRETAWGVVNAAAEWLDHTAEYRAGKHGREDTRAFSLLFGNGVTTLNRVAAALSRLN